MEGSMWSYRLRKNLQVEWGLGEGGGQEVGMEGVDVGKRRA